MKIKGIEYLQHPPSMKALPKSHDRKKYCRLHHDHGHDTEHLTQGGNGGPDLRRFSWYVLMQSSDPVSCRSITSALTGESAGQFANEDYLTKTISIISGLPDPEQKQSMDLLKANANVFAWLATNMHRISSEVITHQLNINPKVKPVRQKKISFAPKRQKVIDEEVDKLFTTDFIRQINYPDWLANTGWSEKLMKNSESTSTILI